MLDYIITEISWTSPEAEAAKAIRFAVFVDEQHVPAELELDDIDSIATHVLATDAEGIACGTGRLYPDPADSARAKVGRMAVAKSARRTGCGAAMLSALLEIARQQGYQQAILSAQAHAVPFYEKFGFKIQGPLYDDAGIPHYTMQRKL
jgi:predicted GNAT family N-acyltransferase